MPKRKSATACLAVMFLACGTSPVRRVIKPIDTSKWEFRDDLPSLPPDLACLGRPFAEQERMSRTFRDPDHPFTPGLHTGIDIPAPAGTVVLAVAAGQVVAVDPVRPRGDPKFENAASVDVLIGVAWSYSVAHLSRVDVKEGDTVVAGQVLGLSGGIVDAPGSGLYTTGPHLHFSLTYLGAYVNPEPYFCRPLLTGETASKKTKNP